MVTFVWPLVNLVACAFVDFVSRIWFEFTFSRFISIIVEYRAGRRPICDWCRVISWSGCGFPVSAQTRIEERVICNYGLARIQPI